MHGSEVRMWVSVTMAPLIPVSSPAAEARSDSGTTPSATTAMSASSTRPLLSMTLRRPPPSSKPVTASERSSSTPFPLRQWWTSAAMSLSRGGSTWSGRWTRVTLTPMCTRFSATSRPMYPPPVTTACVGLLPTTNSRIARVSSTVRRVMTLGSSVPGMSGTRALAPGERTRTS